MMDIKLVKEFCSSLSLGNVYTYLLKYIINHTYFNCKNIAKDLLYKEFGIIKNCNGMFDKYIKSLSYRLSTFIPDLVKGGIIEKYNAHLYKVIREGNGKVEFEIFIRSNGNEESLYLTIPVKTTRQYNLIKDKRAMVNIEILN